MQCAMREMDLVYEEDGWPSIPKITAFFAESPMNSGDIGKWDGIHNYYCSVYKSKLFIRKIFYNSKVQFCF